MGKQLVIVIRRVIVIIKVDVTNVTADFMINQNTLYYVNLAISKLGSSFHTQSDIEDVYSDWCGIVQQNMHNNVPFIDAKYGNCNKRWRPGKPWWSEKLSDLWDYVCMSAKSWLLHKKQGKPFVH